MSAVIVNSQKEFEDLLQAGKPVLVDFWAAWCGPCKMVTPEIEAVAETYADKAIVAKINVDEQSAIASQFNVMSIPTIVVFKDGKEVNRLVGYRPRKEFGDALDAAL